MFNRTQPNPGLDKAIEDTLEYLNGIEDPTHEAYPATLKQLTKLYKLKEQEKPERVSKDALISAGANLIGILAIVEYERVGIVTSKALTFVRKLW